MRDDIEKILDECIDRMNSGESLENCLASYPDHAEELRPLLLAAGEIRNTDLPAINQKAKSAAKIRLNAALVEKRKKAGIMQRLLEMFTVQKSKVFASVSVLLVAILVGVSIYAVMGEGGTKKPGLSNVGAAVSNFSSEEEFAAYLSESSSLYSYGGNSRGGIGSVGFGGLGLANTVLVPVPTPAGKTDSTSSAGGDTQRVSDTNVQVIGIDEPDIVKTDGMNIFFSKGEYYYYYYDSNTDVMPPQTDNGIEIIGAYPPINMSVLSKIDKNGDLLLHDNTLAVFTWNGIYGYDVSDPQNPVSKWEITLNDSTSIVAARLYQGKIYLVTQTYLDNSNPSPIWPLAVKGVSVEIDYSNIYYPVQPIQANITLNAMVFDMQSGNLENTASFIDSSYSSVVYMSGNAIYVAYSYSENDVPHIFEFCTQKCQGILPDSVIAKINRLQTYDISDISKMTEIGVIIEGYLCSISSNERTQVENSINNALQGYYNEHMREIERTGIVKIGLDNLALTATGSVPGSLLNQFSMDEYNGYLRLATTVGNGFGFDMFWVSSESANDIYVLDGTLSVVGSIQDLGLTEQIYSVRFVSDKGYLVTYRQTDPFYILDLSDPLNPQLKGELKIPGYSSYLHPISGDKMLGIGEEDGKVKISFFNVQNPEQPVELDKYILDDSWSDIMNTHHAFLLDEAHEIFFLPGSNSGYVFSYAGDKLELVKVISDIQARRAVYINDNLYILGDNKLVVLNELDWQTVNEIEF